MLNYSVKIPPLQVIALSWKECCPHQQPNDFRDASSWRCFNHCTFLGSVLLGRWSKCIFTNYQWCYMKWIYLELAKHQKVSIETSLPELSGLTSHLVLNYNTKNPHASHCTSFKSIFPCFFTMIVSSSKGQTYTHRWACSLWISMFISMKRKL